MIRDNYPLPRKPKITIIQGTKTPIWRLYKWHLLIVLAAFIAFIVWDLARAEAQINRAVEWSQKEVRYADGTHGQD